MGAIGFTRHAIAPMGRSYALAATSTAPEVGRTGNIRTISVRQPRPALVVELVGLQRQHPFLLPRDAREQERPRFDRIRKEELRSEEHTYELQSLMPTSYAALRLKHKKN